MRSRPKKFIDQDKLRADNDLDILRASLAQTQTQKRNILNAIKAGIFTASTKDELLNLEREEADLLEKLKQAEAALEALPTEDDIISYLEIFRDGCGGQELTVASVLDAFVIRVEVHADHMLIFFRIKKEDRQKYADLPSDLCGGSFSVLTSPLCGTKRTLYHVRGCFILKVPA